MLAHPLVYLIDGFLIEEIFFICLSVVVAFVQLQKVVVNGYSAVLSEPYRICKLDFRLVSAVKRMCKRVKICVGFVYGEAEKLFKFFSCFSHCSVRRHTESNYNGKRRDKRAFFVLVKRVLHKLYCKIKHAALEFFVGVFPRNLRCHKIFQQVACGFYVCRFNRRQITPCHFWLNLCLCTRAKHERKH